MQFPGRVVVAGGSGFLGRALTESLRADGFDVVVLTRKSSSAGQTAAPSERGAVRLLRWTPDGTSGPWASALDGAAGVINLAGESIAGSRWTPARKKHLFDSRVDATNSLVSAIRSCSAPPPVLVSSSAIGYYGVHGDEVLTEKSPPGNDFLATVCVEWERRAQAAGDVTRVVLVRTGVVLDREEGALPQLLRPIRMFVGGPVGSGRQYMSWIHLDDWIAMVRWTIGEQRLEGAVNATAPLPVTNAEFTGTAASVLNRPAVMPVPAFAVRLVVGEMADLLVVGGQRVIPQRALELGFPFRYSELRPALEEIERRAQ